MTPEQIEKIITDLDSARHILYNHGMKETAQEFGVLIKEVSEMAATITQLQEQNAKLEKEVIGLEASNGVLLQDYLGACDEAAKYSSRYDKATLSIKSLGEKNANYKEQIKSLVKEKHRREQ